MQPMFEDPIVSLDTDPYAMEYAIRYWYSQEMDLSDSIELTHAVFDVKLAEQDGALDVAHQKPTKVGILGDMVSIARIFGDKKMERLIFDNLKGILHVMKYTAPKKFMESITEIFDSQSSDADVVLTFQQIATSAVYARPPASEIALSKKSFKWLQKRIFKMAPEENIQNGG
jgi:hypothetical protein